MTVPSDTIYVLSATYHSGDGDGSMYLRGEYALGGNSVNEVATEITEAKVFYSRQDAWNYREDAPSNGWQITPISAKKLFTKKLKST
jgi:hypothetical protein